MRDEAMFRSAQMSLVQICVSNEISGEIVKALGDLGCVHFRDLNAGVSSFQRAFVNDIKSTENSLRQIRYFRDLIKQNGITEAPAWDGQRIEEPESLPHTLQQLEHQVQSLVESQQSLKDKQARLMEFRHVLRAVSNFLGQENHNNAELSASIIAGVIPQPLVPFLQKVSWRALRGNLVFSASAISSPLWDQSAKSYVEKSVFILVTHGSEYIQKAKKIAEAMDGHLFEISGESPHSRLQQVNSQLSEVNDVTEYTQQALNVELSSLAKSITLWNRHFLQERGMYDILNRFSYDVNRKLLIAEGWIPTDDINGVQQALKNISESAQVESPTMLSILETNKSPPTLHRTNKVTEAFQNMVDVYAIATYREVNPGLPTIATFPFMFAVMFGDIGHGFIMFLAALVVVLNERKLAKYQGGDIFDMFYSGRYVVLFMGMFSMFTGLLYNDMFSRSLTLFKSGWQWPEGYRTGATVVAENTGHVYNIGIDWMWHNTENNLRFMNSYKMKLSIILGYIHMLYSYMFSLVNDLYFNSVINIVGNFIPGLIFLLSIFGYLSVCIVYKWTIDWSATDLRPPSLMNMLINMFLSPGQIDEPLYKGQKAVQLFLLAAALVSVPWLLLAKPLALRKKIQERQHIQLPDQEPGDSESEGEEESFGDILIEQTIHTIEFCLNSVSHTASYLRLWALSLAHSQLSQVLWDMTLRLSFGPTGVLGVVLVVVMFSVWMTMTVVILTIMEGTSAMLHALRLHWVESMSKFYVGEGYQFEPFSFKAIEQLNP